MSKIIKLKKDLNIQIEGKRANNKEYICMPEGFFIRRHLLYIPMQQFTQQKMVLI